MSQSKSKPKSDSLQQLTGIARKLHYVLFVGILITVIGLAGITVANTLNAPSDAAFEQKINAEKIVENFGDDPTIPKITKLDFSNQNSGVSLPGDQRINPFTE